MEQETIKILCGCGMLILVGAWIVYLLREDVKEVMEESKNDKNY